MNKNLFRDLDLQLFAEGGAAGGGTSGAAGATGESAAAAGQQPTGEDLSCVVYGKQVPAAAGQEMQTAPEESTGADLDAEFDALVKGKYKDAYGKRVTETVQKRLKGPSDKAAKYDALSSSLEILYNRYGVEQGNTDALNKAIEEDDSYFEDEALERGMSVQDVKALRKMERENRELKAQIEAEQQQKQLDAVYSQWNQESEELKQIYPNFDFDSEWKNNEMFGRLLGAGIDVQTAFEVIHRNERLMQGMQYAAQETERKIARNIAARGSRPSEGGMSRQSASVTKSDVSQLTLADREEIRRRVHERGEKISF